MLTKFEMDLKIVEVTRYILQVYVYALQVESYRSCCIAILHQVHVYNKRSVISIYVARLALSLSHIYIYLILNFTVAITIIVSDYSANEISQSFT